MNLSIIKKEFKENFYAMKGYVWLIIIAIIFSIMSYSFVSVKELSLLAQTEVVVTMGKLILGLGLLITIVLGAVTFSNEREECTLESLLLTPVPKMQLALGKLTGVLLMGISVFIIALPYIITLSYGTGLVLRAILFILIIGSIIAFSYASISISLSILLGSSKNSIITSIILFILTALPSLLSTSIKKAGFGAVIEKISPLSNTFNLMKAVIIEKQGFAGMLKFIMPILIFSVLSYMFLIYGTKKIAFKGGE
ncbi:ABC transporter permease subunit [Clostridium bowmanii]|uniref:ABC transporter permease subunit n=1 Tax=Clostridium bowmanii TaxID=132925 RepID=UPI001C0CDAA2|nr:ABC transporter permease subunit [Clostridium bowmanii]MBU3192237.1 ABC transporter permease subunit [Clostridium bowmanii]MCA1076468.1 ABC transporter permease subunit [Clostridium bowmanii]